MMRARLSLWILASTFVASTAHAEEIGLSLGWSIPGGSIERGSKVSDTVYGTIAIGLDAHHAFTESFGLTLFARYGIAVPTLCASAGDCTSSLGRDVSLGLRARYTFVSLADDLPLVPRIEIGTGYEWFTSTLSDSGVSSSRSHHGPILASIEIAGDGRLSRHVILSPTLSITTGAFAHRELSTPAFTDSGYLGARELHTWVFLGLRAAARW